jgi:RimJ/RimL family protein N-acetyltransferase
VVVLRPVSREAAEAILDGRRPDDVRVADDYPTEFSSGVAQSAAAGGNAFFIERAADGLVVGEIGFAAGDDGAAEIGYAVVESAQNQGVATAAVEAVARLARDTEGVERLRAHTPLDRPNSARVLEKAGFEFVGEVSDEHEGETLTVKRWECSVLDSGPYGIFASGR